MNQTEVFSPLSREEVVAAVEGGNPRRIPLVRAKWWGEGLVEQYGDELKRFDRIPEDVVQLFIGNPVDPSKMNLSWEWRQDGPHDSRAVVDDWSKLDEFLDKLPDPATDVDWDPLEREAEAARRLAPDGFWTSDDLGHQSGPMMSPQIFHELIHPYYRRVGNATRDAGMHFWLHSCGDNTLLLPDLIDAGVNVFHPVQKHTMDEPAVMEQFGGKVTFLAGIDVQHVLQEADADGVRREVRFLIDTFDRPDGRMCIAAGNGIVSGTPVENIEAFLDEAISYGAEHRMRYTEARSEKRQ